MSARGRWLIAAVMALAVALYFFFAPEPAPTGVQRVAEPAVEVAGEKRLPLPAAAPLQVYEPPVKKKLNLPQSVQLDAGKHVVATAKTPADDRPHTVTTVLDVGAGEFTTYDRADPLPWIAVKTTTHVAAYYGLKRGEPTVRVQGQQEILRFKALRVEAIAAVDIGAGAPDAFVGIGARASW